MEKIDLINVLDLARLELKSCYKRIGYSNSNILRAIDDAIEKLNPEMVEILNEIAAGKHNEGIEV